MLKDNFQLSNPIKITYNGETKTLKEWSVITGIRKDRLYKRIFLYRWTIKKALTTKV